jgi:U3 small nucleolar RNA-associated protein 25
MRPFMSSFSIPKNTEDPLASTSATTEYPLDHLVNFRGNSDDNFRIGIKITRKAWRVVMMPANEDKLMECDIIIASPLGIKMQSADLLSSIEVAVVDGIDVMQMQNWDHVQVSPLVHAYTLVLMTVHFLTPQQDAEITSRV